LVRMLAGKQWTEDFGIIALEAMPGVTK
jgi:hypothetical protein